MLTQYLSVVLCRSSFLLACPECVSAVDIPRRMETPIVLCALARQYCITQKFHGCPNQEVTHRFPTFHHQTIQLEELADHSLPLWWWISLSPCISHFPYPQQPEVHDKFLLPPWYRHHAHHIPSLERTFMLCNSFTPFCSRFCISCASFTSLCSRNESFVLRTAYSLKLYAANCWPCLSNWRYWSTLAPLPMNKHLQEVARR